MNSKLCLPCQEVCLMGTTGHVHYSVRVNSAGGHLLKPCLATLCGQDPHKIAHIIFLPLARRGQVVGQRYTVIALAIRQMILTGGSLGRVFFHEISPFLPWILPH